MDNIIRNIFRLFVVGIYPTILILLFIYIYNKKYYKRIINKNLKSIALNTVIFMLVGTLAIFIFFNIEDTIYSYDYAGHWVRSLQLRKLFFENPYEILKVVYNSMNFNDYSSLPALFNLGFIIINTSYGFFCFSNFLMFLLPSFILLQIIYFSYTDKYKYLPLILGIIFYPLYFTIFFGEIDCVGLIFLITSGMLILLPNFDEINIKDNLIINLLMFLAIFLRRWYLYPVVGFYLCYFIKYLIHYNFKPFNKNALCDFIKISLSGIVMLLVIIIFFNPFFTRVIFNNFNEAYSYYDKDGKLFNLFNFYSPIIIIISMYGFYRLFKINKEYFIYSLFTIIIPLFLFWRIQSLEYHHYYIITLSILCLFSLGMHELLSNQKLFVKLFIIGTLMLQSIFIFFPFDNHIPLITNIKKVPQILSYKNKVIELSYYLKSITPESYQSSYLASGSSRFNDDMIRNSILPDISAPNIDTAVLDLRDGFPKDLEYVGYVITIDPIQYLDEDYQHMYSIISNAIWNNKEISKIYNEIHSIKIEDMTIKVYEKTGDFTPAIKQYFYDEMIKFYPDKTEFFSYILD